MKTKNIAPKGSSIVCPYLLVDSVEAQIEFMVKVFNATIREDDKGSDGYIQHGEINIADTTIMIGKANEEWPTYDSSIFVYVENADEVYERALNHNAKSLRIPEDQDYGLRVGGFKDPTGNQWWVGQLIKK
ncbi:VOC family protein [Tenacibaculum singaporense]|uniref:VOC family protein n=1 Tax=Tenacibaculum singaporense TaxID=2358479 RepID=UPI000F670B0B|nr:VOC family protein [Tenacibaculum singaporense]RSC93485.1 VOC family protein [Tenacibaculum singaporense]